MGLSQQEIEETLRDYDEWKSLKANPGGLDLSVSAYMKELEMVRDSNALDEIRGLMLNPEGDTDEAVLQDIQAVLNGDG